MKGLKLATKSRYLRNQGPPKTLIRIMRKQVLVNCNNKGCWKAVEPLQGSSFASCVGADKSIFLRKHQQNHMFIMLAAEECSQDLVMP